MSSIFEILNLRQTLSQLLESHSEERRVGNDRFRAVEHHLVHLKELFMALTPEVQALVDQDAKLKASVDAMKGKLDTVSAQVLSLQSKLAAAPAAGISAEDLEAIKAVTADISATVAEAQDAVATPADPAPVADAPAADAPAADAPAADAPAADAPVADAPAADAAAPEVARNI
ncbi:MAG: hypothetical protein JWP25_386 [Bradyrhizobium sp.]|nr:hypothetical protein [Bradyrhizobium sp.]